ncbi:YrzA family protein [Alkalihalobacterium elongatum]|uniref:YrzA family protein n=1 Tax=Alkalihalobacterium elongatum TaxID=2675466 RepID=UPI001C1F740A|nr:YrzA family protein [Alkalihalobacterium elongatum]
MQIHLDTIEDKVECFEARSLKELEKKINEQIDNNKVLMLQVHHIQHHVYIDQKTSLPIYTAVVHFKAKK